MTNGERRLLRMTCAEVVGRSTRAVEDRISQLDPDGKCPVWEDTEGGCYHG